MPLRKTSTVVWIAVVLVLLPIAIWLLLSLASKSAPSDSQEHTKRTDVVLPQPHGT